MEAVSVLAALIEWLGLERTLRSSSSNPAGSWQTRVPQAMLGTNPAAQRAVREEATGIWRL